MTHITFNSAIITKQTDKAVFVAIWHTGANNENLCINGWLPKSQLSINNEVLTPSDYCPNAITCDITMPVWLSTQNTKQHHNPKAHYNR